ncbi:MAG: hypothetical protein L6Q76_00100 [Polyangiaceae bacterium]|nr:hypothetical protein [Polyangiaceae bacterium]
MTDLFARAVVVQVDTLRLRELDVAFEVNRSLDASSPNTCELKLYNLREDHRSQLGERASVRCVLEAGYRDRTSVIFAGELRNVRSERDGADIVTKAETGDGERRRRTARTNRSHAPGTTLETVVRDLASTMGVGIGNTEQMSALTSGRQFRHGTVTSGNAPGQLGRVLRGAGLEHSVQDGQLQVLRRGDALAGTAVVLSPSTGLIGSPVKELDERRRQIVTAKCLMIPDLVPGRRVRLEAAEIDGEYRVEKARYQGYTKGEDWYIELELRGVR